MNTYKAESEDRGNIAPASESPLNRALADNAKLRAEVERERESWKTIHNEFNKMTERVTETEIILKAAEARETALVDCLRDLKNAVEQYRVAGFIGSLERIKAWQYLLAIAKKADALLPAQPRQTVPDPSLTLIRKLTDALQEALAASDRQLMRVGFLTESKRLIARATQYWREHGADSPEAGKAKERS